MENKKFNAWKIKSSTRKPRFQHLPLCKTVLSFFSGSAKATKKSLDRSPTKGFFFSQFQNLTSRWPWRRQTKWIPFAWLLLEKDGNGLNVWWKREENSSSLRKRRRRPQEQLSSNDKQILVKEGRFDFLKSKIPFHVCSSFWSSTKTSAAWLIRCNENDNQIREKRRHRP